MGKVANEKRKNFFKNLARQDAQGPTKEKLPRWAAKIKPAPSVPYCCEDRKRLPEVLHFRRCPDCPKVVANTEVGSNLTEAHGKTGRG